MKGEGCHAFGGFQGPNRGEHQVNLEVGFCDGKSTIQHELFHSLGVAHEHVRPDRDDYLTVNWPRIDVSFLYIHFYKNKIIVVQLSSCSGSSVLKTLNSTPKDSIQKKGAELVL